MADIRLTEAEATGTDLPKCCMDCGAPSTTVSERSYSTDTVTLLPPILDGGVIGVLLLPLWGCLAIIKLVSWSSARTMTVRAPLCDKHAHGWFVTSPVEMKSITDSELVLTGVADAFAEAWARRAARIEMASDLRRCRYCATINAPYGRFCTQCGAVI